MLIDGQLQEKSIVFPMIAMPAKSKGFSLIEVLVTLLVVSIGIFSILAVITVSLQLNSSSVYRTIASQQAYAMAEVLRANPTTLGTVNSALAVTFATPGAAGTSALCWNGTGCARNNYVATTLDAWNQQLAAVLPSGTGTVCLDSTPYDGTPGNWACDGATVPQAPYVVKVCWNESRITASSSVTGGPSGGGTSSTGGVLCTFTNL
jgi:type IV pilus assembly protein PilV